MQEADDYYDEPVDDDFDDPDIEAVGVPMVPAIPADATPEDAVGIAEATHEQALAVANQGGIQEALVLFKRAVELWPHKDVYWSNLGVTEMRMGLLDDALFSYTRGLRLNPKSKLITENMNALKGASCDVKSPPRALFLPRRRMPCDTIRIAPDHLAYRDRQQKGAGSEISSPVEEAVGPDGEPAPVEDRSGATDKELAQWLGPWWRKRHQLKGMFTEAMTSYKPIQIRNFLRKDKAAALHRFHSPPLPHAAPFLMPRHRDLPPPSRTSRTLTTHSARELYESEHFKVYESYSRW